MSLVRCKSTFIAPGRVRVRAGRVFDSSDPLVRDRVDLFELVQAEPFGVEQATAAPGETRSTVRPKKTAAKKTAAKS